MEQTESKRIVIVGAGSVGGHVAYNLEEYGLVGDLIGFLDDDTSKIGHKIFGLQVLGPISTISHYAPCQVVIGIAFPKIKQKILKGLEGINNLDYPKLVSKHAWVSKNVEIGVGSIIYPGCSINYNSSIGDFVVMNLNCAIGHDTVIGDYSSLAPGVNTGGHTHIGELTAIGIGASTRQSVNIGSDCVIGGNAMIVNDIDDGSLVYGVPAKGKLAKEK